MEITGYECFPNGTIRAKKMNVKDSRLVGEIKKVCASYRMRLKAEHSKTEKKRR